MKQNIHYCWMFPMLASTSVHAFVDCSAIDPGGYLNENDHKYLVVGGGDGSHDFDLKNPEVLFAIVNDGLRVCTSHVDNLDGLFVAQEDWPQHYNPEIQDWDVRAVTSMRATFKGVTDFDQDISAWHTEKVTDMTEMFYGATAFSQNLSAWPVKNVIAHRNFATDSGIDGDQSKLPHFVTPEILIEGRIEYPIPEHTVLGDTYDFNYTFINVTDDFTAHQLSFEDNFMALIAEGVELDFLNSSCMYSTSLAPHEHCNWVGQFTPQRLKQEVKVEMKAIFAEGEPVLLTDETVVTPLVVETQITTALPETVFVGESYPFSYQFSNPTSHHLSQLYFDNQLFPEEGVEVDAFDSSCYQLPLMGAHEHCTWHGSFTPQYEGEFTLASTMHYLQGDPSTIQLQGIAKEKITRPATAAINDMPGDGPGWRWPEPRFEAYVQADGSACADILQDKLTGLLWSKNGNASGALTHEQAETYVSQLSLCDLGSDWRLPNINELSSLVNYDASNSLSPAAWLNQPEQGFVDIQENYYWSAQHGYEDAQWWGIYMQSGNMIHEPGSRLAIAVHGKMPHQAEDSGAVIPDNAPGGTGAGAWPEPRFTPAYTASGELCTDALVDQLNGTMWAIDGGFASNQADAVAHVTSLALCGYEDWSLPSLTEMRSMVYYQVNPTPAQWLVDQGFANIKAGNYWTQTPAEGEQTWAVQLNTSPQIQPQANTGNLNSLPVRHINNSL